MPVNLSDFVSRFQHLCLVLKEDIGISLAIVDYTQTSAGQAGQPWRPIEWSDYRLGNWVYQYMFTLGHYSPLSAPLGDAKFVFVSIVAISG